MTAVETELFDSKEYEVPFAKADGREVTALLLRLSGGLKLNRNDAEHVALVESLTLGRMVTLNVTASVEGKGQNFREEADGSEVVTHTVVLRIHEVVGAE